MQETKCVDDAFRASPSKRLDTIVIPTELDARHPDRWVGDALFLPGTRQKFRVLYHLGLTDAVRAGSDGPGPYTFWDYQAGAWQKNDGIRIDHLLLSPQAADRLIAAGSHSGYCDQRADPLLPLRQARSLMGWAGGLK